MDQTTVLDLCRATLTTALMLVAPALREFLVATLALRSGAARAGLP